MALEDSKYDKQITWARQKTFLVIWSFWSAWQSLVTDHYLLVVWKTDFWLPSKLTFHKKTWVQEPLRWVDDNIRSFWVSCPFKNKTNTTKCICHCLIDEIYTNGFVFCTGGDLHPSVFGPRVSGPCGSLRRRLWSHGIHQSFACGRHPSASF